jgi:hypothetical protein
VDELTAMADRSRDMKQAKRCVERLLNKNQNLRVQIAQQLVDELRPACRAAHVAGEHFFLEEVINWLRVCYVGREELIANTGCGPLYGCDKPDSRRRR